MITELGHFALALAAILSVFLAIVPLSGVVAHSNRLVAMAPPAGVGVLILVGTAFAALVNAYVTSDFSVLNVAENSHTAKPLFYKISGVWGNHEGSMLLWALVLAVFTGAVALTGRDVPPRFKATVLGIQGMVSTGFLFFILLTSNPFTRLGRPPLEGNGLNPILQDPGLALHPPFLYLGYVGFSVAFSFALAGLVERRIDRDWARWVRPWVLLAWAFLTVGIALGSWWAYYELGWGGWWFWDPVENASFMPWLTGTALLHAVVILAKRDALRSWTVFLAIVTFSLSLLGTFLVRSGVLTSVHAFASSPSRGLFILVLLALTVGGSLLLFALRAPALRTAAIFAPASREGGIIFGNALLGAAAGTVLVGTLYPLFIDVLDLGKISVGAPFFNMAVLPMLGAVVLLMAVVPLLAWKRGGGKTLARTLRPGAVVTGLAAASGWVLAPDGEGVLAAIGLGLAGFILAATLAPLARRKLTSLTAGAWGMTLAHSGVGIVVAAITIASIWQIETVRVLTPGETLSFAGHRVTLTGLTDVSGPDYTAVQGVLAVTKDGADLGALRPEKRTYIARGQPTTEAAIRSTLTGDLYAALGDASGEGRVVRLYWKPFVNGLWIGSALMLLGGLIALRDRLSKAPVRPRRTA